MKLAQLDARSPIRLFEKLARDMVNLIVALIDGQRIRSFADLCFLLFSFALFYVKWRKLEYSGEGLLNEKAFSVMPMAADHTNGRLASNHVGSNN